MAYEPGRSNSTLSETNCSDFYKQARDPGTKGISRYREIATHLREIFRNPRRSGAATTITRGSTFNTEFAGEPDDDIIDTQALEKGSSSAVRSRKRAGSNSIHKEAPLKRRIESDAQHVTCEAISSQIAGVYLRAGGQRDSNHLKIGCRRSTRGWKGTRTLLMKLSISSIRRRKIDNQRRCG